MLSDHLFKYVAVFGISTLIVVLLTPLFIKIAPRVGLMDVPDERCIHKNITPLGGGVVVFIAFHLSCFALFYPFFSKNFGGLLDKNWWLAFFVSSSILLVVGLIDDRQGMSALTKLFGQALATLFFYVLSGYHVNLLGIDFGFFGGLCFVLIWTIAIINAFNLIDGLDGLCSGLAMISAAGLAAVFIFRAVPGDGLICLALVGACAGFLYHNFFPAKVFLGDTGSMFLGFALASISLYAGGKGSFFVILAAPFFIAGIPIIDTLLAIWRRSIRKTLAQQEGRPAIRIMQADKEHLHHRLLDYGLQQHQVALVLYAVNVSIVGMGLLFLIFQEFAVGLFLIVFLLTLYLLIKYVLQIELWETHKLMARASDSPELTRFSLIFYPLFDLVWMSLSVLLACFIVAGGEVPFHSMGEWVMQLPLWEMPVFGFLFASKSYIKCWRNGFFRDYLFLVMAILAGCSVSLALHFFQQNTAGLLLVNKASLFCFLTLMGLIAVRIPHHFIREWGIAHAESNTTSNRRNVLLYGAGAHGGLYLRERYLRHAHELGAINIIGFIDDNAFLRHQYTYGKEVLGSLVDLNDLITQYQIHEVVLTTDISDRNLCDLKKIATDNAVILKKWHAYTVDI